MKNKGNNNFFERHPKKTILITILIGTVLLDFTLAKTYELVFGYSLHEKRVHNAKSIEKSFRIKSEIYHHDLAKNMKIDDAYWGDIAYRISTDSLGFKNESIKNIAIVPDKYRIMFIGDSFTEGIGVEYLDTFVGLVSVELSKKNFEVLNAGVITYSPIIYWRKIKYLLEDVGLKFNELVVFIDLSDAQNETDWYFLGEDNTVKNRRAKRKSKKEETKISLNKTIKSNSLVLFRIIKKVRDTFFPKLPDYINYNLGDSNSYGKKYAKGLKSMEQYMGMLYNLLEKHDIQMTVVVYPWPYQIINNDLEPIHVSLWRDWSKERNIRFLNYFPNFINFDSSELKNKLTIKKYFISGDIHWNRDGHRLIADAFISFYSDDSDMFY